jgi:ferredoxin
MRVTVDLDRCQGHGVCVMNASQIFDFDDLGYAIVRVGHVDHALVDLARRAAGACPERAITLTDD